jgi:hypothetical protein
MGRAEAKPINCDLRIDDGFRFALPILQNTTLRIYTAS